MTLRSSGFWSLTLGFFLLMSSNQTTVPAAPVEPGQELPTFSNQSQVSGPVDETSGKVTISVFERPDCGECHAFAIHGVVPIEQLYRYNPSVELNVYVLPESLEVVEGESSAQLDMAKHLICAGEQDLDDYWALYYEFHTKEELLDTQGIADLILEKELEIDSEALNTCLEGEEVEKTLKKQQELAQLKKVDFYPTTIIQDVRFIHSQPLENLMHTVNEKSLEMQKIE